MTDFAWIIPLDKANALGSGGISSSYIIPKNHVSDDLTKMKGATIWMVLRGERDRCIGFFRPKRIERFSEGYHKDDFLVRSDLKRSIRLTQGYDTAKTYEINHTQQLSIGFHPIAEQELKILLALVKDNVQVKLLRPNVKVSEKAKLNLFTKNSEAIATTVLSHVASNYSLDQVWGAGTGHKLKPFGNFALHTIINHGINPEATIVEALRNNDPIQQLFRNGWLTAIPNSESKKTQSRPVDLEFTEIDPANIYAREFVFSNALPFDIEETLNKTEVAEKAHQGMLRDISMYLKKIGIKPYESQSIDLMIDLNGKVKIFEIKSANENNLLAQSAKGAFQVACYLNAMASDYTSLEGSLILHKVSQSRMQDIVSRALSRMHINYLIYDPSLEWPDRVKGLITE